MFTFLAPSVEATFPTIPGRSCTQAVSCFKALPRAVIYIAIGIGLQALVAVAVVAMIHRRPAMRPWWIGLGVGTLCYLGVGLGVFVAATGVGLGPSPFDVFLWPVLVGQVVGLSPTGD